MTITIIFIKKAIPAVFQDLRMNEKWKWNLFTYKEDILDIDFEFWKSSSPKIDATRNGTWDLPICAHSDNCRATEIVHV